MNKSYKELENNHLSYIFTKLKGINEEDIVFRMTNSLTSSIEKLGNISIYSNSDNMLLDSLASATLEGADTTLENVKKSFNNPVTKSDKMVVNTFKAQEFVYKNNITSKNIRDVWNIIVDDVCENISADGVKYRSGMVYIGNAFQVVHTPEIPSKLELRMNSLFDFINSTQDTVLKACVVHFYIAYIHPFCDGNGRFARTWMNKILSGVDTWFKNTAVSQEILNHVSDYYKSLRYSEFSFNGVLDITPFLEYMTSCILLAAYHVNCYQYDNLSDLEQKVLHKMHKNNSGLTVSKLSKMFNISKSKSRTLLNRLVDKRYLLVDKSGKEYKYFAK